MLNVVSAKQKKLYKNVVRSYSRAIVSFPLGFLKMTIKSKWSITTIGLVLLALLTSFVMSENTTVNAKDE